MSNTRIEMLEEKIFDLEVKLEQMKARPTSAPKKPSNGRPDVCCFVCGGEQAEIQHTGDGRMTFICRECKAVFRLPVEILKKPDHGHLCELGLVDTCLGLCGDKDDADDREMIKTGKPLKK